MGGINTRNTQTAQTKLANCSLTPSFGLEML